MRLRALGSKGEGDLDRGFSSCILVLHSKGSDLDHGSQDVVPGQQHEHTLIAGRNTNPRTSPRPTESKTLGVGSVICD